MSDSAAFDVHAVCNAVAGSTGLMLFEGLPHQTFEKHLLAEELRTKDVRQFGGFPFYREPMYLHPGDAVLLRTFFSRPDAFPPYSGSKLCGGFHPDYAIWWLGAHIQLCTILCFGCMEVMSLSEGLILHTDWKPSEWVKVYRALSSYRVNRPGGHLNIFDDLVAKIAASELDFDSSGTKD
jgi:hypothetical protein